MEGHIDEKKFKEGIMDKLIKTDLIEEQGKQQSVKLISKLQVTNLRLMPKLSLAKFYV